MYVRSICINTFKKDIRHWKGFDTKGRMTVRCMYKQSTYNLYIMTCKVLLKTLFMLSMILFQLQLIINRLCFC